MSYCEKHRRYACYETLCRERDRFRGSSVSSSSGDLGSLGINTEGNVTFGLGSGLTYDVSDGSIGLSTGPGFSVDFG